MWSRDSSVDLPGRCLRREGQTCPHGVSRREVKERRSGVPDMEQTCGGWGEPDTDRWGHQWPFLGGEIGLFQVFPGSIILLHHGDGISGYSFLSPANPSPSVVVALTLTRPDSI